MRTVTLTAPYRNEGTIMLFDTDDGFIVAVDHRPAMDILAEMEDRAEAGLPIAIDAEVDDWQIVGRS